MRRALTAAALTAVTLTTIGILPGYLAGQFGPHRPAAETGLLMEVPDGGNNFVPSSQRPPSDLARARRQTNDGNNAAPSRVGRAPAKPSAAAPGGPRSSPVRVGSKVVFVGDYGTGDFSQWGTCQSVVMNSSCSGVSGSHHSMQIVQGPGTRLARYAARFVVRNGDVPDFGGGERSEVSARDDGAATREGDERWYQWSMRFPEGFPNPGGDWFIVMQWHSGSGSPPLSVNVSNEGTVDVLWASGGHFSKTIGPVRRGEWVDYTMHVKFANSAATGFVEAWENGKLTVPKTQRATMASDENYLKQGIYRDNGGGTAEVSIAGLRVTAP